TNDGVDRGVRYYANYCSTEGELNVVKDEGHRIGKITISGADLSEYVIVNPEPDNENMSFTADELRTHLGNACGVYPEIVTEANADAYAITLVRDSDGSDYGDENFNIKSHDRGITITGGKYRGCMYGMYTLLEEYIGIRFYYKFGATPDRGDYAQTYVYEADEIVIGADDIDLFGEGSIYSRCGYSDSPYFSPALKYNGNMYDKTSGDYAYAGLYGTYGVAGNVTHGMHALFENNDSLFAKYDPNYVQGRNPCFTCEDLFDETYRRVIADLDHRVNVDGMTPMMERYMCCIDVAHLDTPDFCWCEDCTAVYIEDGAVSGAIIRFANKMVEALADTPYSEIYVGCFAYYGTTKPPRVTRPDDQVIVNFCFYISDDKKTTICANHSLNDPDCEKNKHFTELYDQWCEITDKTFIWYYPTVAYYFANTTQDLFKMYGDIQYLAERGTYGIMALQDNMDPSATYFIKWYMLQRMMWDADMSYEEYVEYMKEYLYLNYGDGYESVFDYLEIMDRAGDGDNSCWAGIIDAPMYKMDFSVIKQNADLILELYENAKRLARSTYEEQMVERIFMFARYHIAIATHTDMWLNGSESDRAAYKENLDTFVSENTGAVLFLDWGAYPWKFVPAAGTFNYDVNPIEWMREKSLPYWDENYNY
ncbi:MAG: DUF4838 domain-containing protein, partial [Clostridia bacterium]|nr:DUF4838 domain-containing protein [Clostridia bacterium]